MFLAVAHLSPFGELRAPPKAFNKRTLKPLALEGISATTVPTCGKIIPVPDRVFKKWKIRSGPQGSPTGIQNLQLQI